MKIKKYQIGFTLVEVAIVLVIVGLLVSAFLAPLSAQRDLKDYSQVRTDLAQIQEALYGFAVANGRLPCPDTIGNDGAEDPCVGTTSATSTGGNLPWVTLGVQANDPWNRPYQYRINDGFGTTFTFSTAGSGAGILKVYTDSVLGTTLANNVPAVIYASGKNGAVQPPISADELENRTTAGTKFDANFVSHDFSPTFDDVVVWISPNILFNRMVAAGKLP
jgi:prepilin-type N-terminal cleavage/methylation domain-containing protein